jgi:hypothetical protein
LAGQRAERRLRKDAEVDQDERERREARKPRDRPGGCAQGLRRALLPAPLLEVA